MSSSTLRRPRVNAGAGGPSTARIATATAGRSSPTRPPIATEQSNSSTTTNESESSMSGRGETTYETDPTSLSEGMSGESSKDTGNLVHSPSLSAPTSPIGFDGTVSQDSLCQLVYTSSARDRYLTREHLQTILNHSRHRNASKGITGLLLYRDGTFAQFLEGPIHHVEALFETIRQDERHRGVIVVLKRQGLQKRDFDGWRMAYRDLDQELGEENADENSGQVGKPKVEGGEKACLIDLTQTREKDLTHHQMSSSIRTLIKVFHGSLARAN